MYIATYNYSFTKFYGNWTRYCCNNGGVYTVTCRAEDEEEIRYKLLKDENEAFGCQPFGSVLSCLPCVVLECYKLSTGHSTSRT